MFGEVGRLCSHMHTSCMRVAIIEILTLAASNAHTNVFQSRVSAYLTRYLQFVELTTSPPVSSNCDLLCTCSCNLPCTSHVQALSTAACHFIKSNTPVPLWTDESPWRANAALISVAVFSYAVAVSDTCRLNEGRRSLEDGGGRACALVTANRFRIDCNVLH